MIPFLHIHYRKRVGLFLFLLAWSAALQAQVTGTLQYDGISRGYELYVPTSWSPGQSFPLVFVLHGTTQDGAGIMNISDFNVVAEANDFIVVYPDGVGGSWNTGITGASTADDLGYIDALATLITQQYGVDPTRIYSCGFSAGGYFSHRLACESPRCFAAIASVAGTMMPDASAACAPARPTPVMQIHGTSDLVVAYNGGAISGLGAEDVIAQWNLFNNCPAIPVITQLPNINLLDFSTVEQQIWAPCDLNGSNVLLKVNGGGHQWPGTSSLLGGLGVINQDIDASEEIWDFFSSYSCDDLATSNVMDGSDRPTIFFDAASGILHLVHAVGLQRYLILDASGRSMQRGELAASSCSITVDAFPPGLYLMIAVGSDRTVFRFVKP